MKILDCETTDTMLDSLQKIINIPKDLLKDFLVNFNVDQYYKNHPKYHESADNLLLTQMQKMYKLSYTWDVTCWFHLTRTFDKDNFKLGILPLNQTINKIWDSLYLLIKDRLSVKEWYNFRCQIETESDNHHANLYRMKLADSLHWGPYAMLIRNMLLKPRK